MRILIIEDEVKTAKALALLIRAIRPDGDLLGPLQTVEAAVKYLLDHQTPDLIFMDIQLADGLCFEIFKSVKVTAPVIFCTAYDQYAIEAFKANGIAYILKPFSKDSLAAAFEKVTLLKSHYGDQVLLLDQLAGLLDERQEFQGKQSFLVTRHHKYLSIPTETIAFFYVRNESATIMTSDGQEYALTQSLEEIAASLNPMQFYRVNRQYLISFKAIVEVEHYFARKLLVKMTPATPETLLVGKDKTSAFLSWLQKR